MTRELQEKLESYQRVWAEVDLDAIWENMVHMKENIAIFTNLSHYFLLSLSIIQHVVVATIGSIKNMNIISNGLIFIWFVKS